MKSYANLISERTKNGTIKKSEWETIKNFTKQQGVVVTKSDKGNSVVVLDDSTYYTKGYVFQ